MEVIQIQGKGPLLDIHKIFHVYKQHTDTHKKPSFSTIRT